MNSRDKIKLRNDTKNGIEKYDKYGFKTLNSDSKLDTKNGNPDLNLVMFNTLNNEDTVPRVILKKDELI